MKFRFIGQYTNGRTSISSNGHVFVGREPMEVSEDAIERLLRHPEFEVVRESAFTSDVLKEYMAENGDKPFAPKRRGRKPKAAD